MNTALLKERFAALPQEEIDVIVSSINAYRAFIGNGVAVGKLAEPIIARLLENREANLFSFPFVFTGKNPPFDIMFYRGAEPIPSERFSNLRKLYSKNFSTFCRATSSLVGGLDNWCGISIKNYINKEAQISTNYAIREFCESRLGNELKTYDDPDLVSEVYAHISAQLSHETILILSSFPNTSKYQFSMFAADEIPITEIEYKKLDKHTRYIFKQNGQPVFHLKYGKNQANPYQRGIWVDDLSKMSILRTGSYRQSDYGNYILNGAFRIHEGGVMVHDATCTQGLNLFE
jgi:hypothetical protein